MKERTRDSSLSSCLVRVPWIWHRSKCSHAPISRILELMSFLLIEQRNSWTFFCVYDVTNVLSATTTLSTSSNWCLIVLSDNVGVTFDDFTWIPLLFPRIDDDTRLMLGPLSHAAFHMDNFSRILLLWSWNIALQLPVNAVETYVTNLTINEKYSRNN